MQTNPTQLFIALKTQQAVRSLETTRLRAPNEHTLLGLALLVGHVQVNPLARPVPTVRAAILRLQAETRRQAARLATELIARYHAAPRSQEGSKAIDETIQACKLVFPREAALLRRSCRDSLSQGPPNI